MRPSACAWAIPRRVITTAPRPTALLRELLGDEDVRGQGRPLRQRGQPRAVVPGAPGSATRHAAGPTGSSSPGCSPRHAGALWTLAAIDATRVRTPASRADRRRRRPQRGHHRGAAGRRASSPPASPPQTRQPTGTILATSSPEVLARGVGARRGGALRRTGGGLHRRRVNNGGDMVARVVRRRELHREGLRKAPSVPFRNDPTRPAATRAPRARGIFEQGPRAPRGRPRETRTR